jgi:very-short-patch-repair endonuclease
MADEYRKRSPAPAPQGKGLTGGWGGNHTVIADQPVDWFKKEQSKKFRKAPTRQEAILWQALRGRQLGGKFRRQQIIAGFIADFYCNEASLVVEIDGATHDGDYDAQRDAIIGARNIRVLRFSDDDVDLRLTSVLQTIKAHLALPPPRLE